MEKNKSKYAVSERKREKEDFDDIEQIANQKKHLKHQSIADSCNLDDP